MGSREPAQKLQRTAHAKNIGSGCFWLYGLTALYEAKPRSMPQVAGTTGYNNDIVRCRLEKRNRRIGELKRNQLSSA
jgi:hypothetical protein